MHGADFLRDLVVVLGAAVIVVALLRPLRVPSIAGFIFTGVLAGPSGLGLVSSEGHVQALAETGVVLLLFGIGLELSLGRLKRVWRAALIGGSVQVFGTIAATIAVSTAMGLELASAILLGFVVAVSSTAVVLRGLATRGELDAPHGKVAVGILVFQDLCVIPMILAIPLLAGEGGSTRDILTTIATAAGVLGGVVFAARVLVPPLLRFVARTRQRELFVLSVFLICFGTAWLVSMAGISVALGAFLGGLVVAGSEFRHQAMSDLIPAREVLASLFFVSIGMLLDLSNIAGHGLTVLALLLAILFGKFAIVFATARLLRLPTRVATLSGATLCQVGEFSFVLLNQSKATELLSTGLQNNVLIAIILSMMLTPMIIAFGPHLAIRAARVPWLNDRLGAQPPGVDPDEPHADHVIVAGYGVAGRELCEVLRQSDIPYVAVDVNTDNVRAARAAGARAVLGDVTHRDLLEELGCERARLVVVSINDARAALLAVRVIRETAPHVPILVRSQYVMDAGPLRDSGATVVVSAEQVATHAVIDTTADILGRPLPG
ncbi:MAG: cation:proton antiporter [Myxococcota bacterium]